ncbi:hypothetical protein [Neobacillus jeddahensis]|uniref:hypothetical protein n=1 Tax=Neobacillus jeddahensis TaxID=1461580 RepID=UPI000B3358A7|nr:hypothetical protein [Neobacillus jeddahensis]
MSSKDKKSNDKKEKKKKEDQADESVKTIVSVRNDEPASSPVPVRRAVSASKNEMEQLQQDLQDLNSTVTALFRIPVFFSQQGLSSLGSIPPEPPYTKQQQFIIRMFKEIKNELLFPKTLPTTEQNDDTSLQQIRRMVNSSYGFTAALLQPARPTDKQEPYSPFLQIEPAMAYQKGLPILLVIEDTMLDQAGGIWIGQLAPVKLVVWFSDASDSIEQFFNSGQWQEALQDWSVQVRSRFLEKWA